MTAMPIFHANDYKTTAGKMLPAERQGFEPLTETINIHGTTHEKISARFEWEQPHLNSIPYQALIRPTAYTGRCIRTVRSILKTTGLCCRTPGRQTSDSPDENDQLRIFENHHLVVVYDIPQTKGNLVQRKAVL